MLRRKVADDFQGQRTCSDRPFPEKQGARSKGLGAREVKASPCPQPLIPQSPNASHGTELHGLSL